MTVQLRLSTRLNSHLSIRMNNENPLKAGFRSFRIRSSLSAIYVPVLYTTHNVCYDSVKETTSMFALIGAGWGSAAL